MDAQPVRRLTEALACADHGEWEPRKLGRDLVPIAPQYARTLRRRRRQADRFCGGIDPLHLSRIEPTRLRENGHSEQASETAWMRNGQGLVGASLDATGRMLASTRACISTHQAPPIFHRILKCARLERRGWTSVTHE